jgi:prepilin-type N-terminal cleavage/methylation domain-containing protein
MPHGAAPDGAARARVRGRRTLSLRAGFTLLELMVVILIISILATFLIPRITSAIERAEVTACQANLRAINQGLIEYRTKYSKLPNGSGVAFFASIIADKVWNAEQATSKQMSCPAVDQSMLTPAQDGLPLKDWYKDLDQIDGGYSSYAGRDLKRHPLRKHPSTEDEAIVADDNDGGANHGTTTNVLWGNGIVIPLEVVELQKDGTLPPGDDILYITVGPDSEVESLRKLSLD